MFPHPKDTHGDVFVGWLDGFDPNVVEAQMNDGVEYADRQCHNVHEGWYEFKCPVKVRHVNDAKN